MIKTLVLMLVAFGVIALSLVGFCKMTFDRGEHNGDNI